MSFLGFFSAAPFLLLQLQLVLISNQIPPATCSSHRNTVFTPGNEAGFYHRPNARPFEEIVSRVSELDYSLVIDNIIKVDTHKCYIEILPNSPPAFYTSNKNLYFCYDRGGNEICIRFLILTTGISVYINGKNNFVLHFDEAIKLDRELKFSDIFGKERSCKKSNFRVIFFDNVNSLRSLFGPSIVLTTKESIKNMRLESEKRQGSLSSFLSVPSDIAGVMINRRILYVQNSCKVYNVKFVNGRRSRESPTSDPKSSKTADIDGDDAGFASSVELSEIIRIPRSQHTVQATNSRYSDLILEFTFSGFTIKKFYQPLMSCIENVGSHFIPNLGVSSDMTKWLPWVVVASSGSSFVYEFLNYERLTLLGADTTGLRVHPKYSNEPEFLDGMTRSSTYSSCFRRFTASKKDQSLNPAADTPIPPVVNFNPDGDHSIFNPDNLLNCPIPTDDTFEASLKDELIHLKISSLQQITIAYGALSVFFFLLFLLRFGLENAKSRKFLPSILLQRRICRLN